MLNDVCLVVLKDFVRITCVEVLEAAVVEVSRCVGCCFLKGR